MRHRLSGKILSRDTNARKALIRNLTVALVKNGKIKTSQAKAKAIKGFVDKIINKGKIGSLHARRQLIASLASSKMAAIVIDKLSPSFPDRTSGYTRIVKLGRRQSDTTHMVMMEFVQGVALEEKKLKPVSLPKKPAKSKAKHKSKTKVVPKTNKKEKQK